MWAVISASVTGTSHGASSTPCQDYCSVLRSNLAGQDVLLIGISDGAGSASHSHLGSEEAVHHLLKIVIRDDPDPATISANQIREWYNEVLGHLVEISENNSIALSDVACTLLLAVISPQGAVFAQVGDGAWVVDQGGNLTVAAWPTVGEYANLTVFITSKGALSADKNGNFANLSFRRYEGPIDAIAGFSDGLQSLVLDYLQKAPSEGFFRKIFDQLRSVHDEAAMIVPLHELLSSELINSRTDDDKTLVIGVWKEPTVVIVDVTDE